MSELRVIARHAGTVLVGQLAVMSFGIADTLIAGRYSPQALAVEAAECMEQHRINSVLVVDDQGRLVGALNTNDLMRTKVI